MCKITYQKKIIENRCNNSELLHGATETSQTKVKETKTRMKEKDLKCRKQRHTSSVHTPRETNGVI